MNSLDDLKSQLLLQAKTLLPTWLPNGKFRGREYVALNPTRNDRSLDSFSINTETGEWSDFATGDKGSNLIELYRYTNQITFREAIDRLRNDQALPTDYKNSKPGNINNSESKIRFAKKLYSNSLEIKNSLGEQYLNHRGIYNIHPNVRFLSRHKHPVDQGEYPIIICPVMNLETNELRGIHRIFLNPTLPQKASIEPNKMMLGDIRGYGVPLFYQSNPETLIICEGLETALSLYQVEDFSVLAMLSAGNLQEGIQFSNYKPKKVIIAADNDDPGKAAAQKAAIRFLDQDIQVEIALPKRGKDFNDTLNYKGEV